MLEHVHIAPRARTLCPLCRDVVHRDVKLDNLLLVEPGDISRIKIADFGCAPAGAPAAARARASLAAALPAWQGAWQMR